MSFEPSPQQALAIFSMIFGCKAEQQYPTKKQLGLPAAQRAELVKHDFLELTKVAPRTEHVSLSEIAWAWAANHLDATLPDKPAIWRAALGGMLVRLREHLTITNGTLAEFAPAVELSVVVEKVPPKAARATSFTTRIKKRKAAASKSSSTRTARKRPKDGTAGREAKAHASAKALAAAKKTKASKVRKAPKKARSPKVASRTSTTSDHELVVRTPNAATTHANGTRALADRIRKVCIELGDGATRVRVRLRDLRARLLDVPRAQLDQTLQALQLSGALVLYRIDDPTDISGEDASAALHIAGHPRHILYLER